MVHITTICYQSISLEHISLQHFNYSLILTKWNCCNSCNCSIMSSYMSSTTLILDRCIAIYFASVSFQSFVRLLTSVAFTSTFIASSISWFKNDTSTLSLWAMSNDIITATTIWFCFQCCTFWMMTIRSITNVYNIQPLMNKQ